MLRNNCVSGEIIALEALLSQKKLNCDDFFPKRGKILAQK